MAQASGRECANAEAGQGVMDRGLPCGSPEHRVPWVGRHAVPRESRCLHAAYIWRAEGGVPLHEWGRKEREVGSSRA